MSDIIRRDPRAEWIARNKRFIVIPYVQATPGIDNVLAIETLAKGFHPQ